VLKISHLYAIESLESDVIQYLLSQPFYEENLFAIFNLATLLNLEPLALKFIEHIQKNGQALIQSEYFTDLSPVSFHIP